MKHGEGGDALVLEAREMLATGQGEEEVFAELAARTGDWDACALALCLALGVSRPDRCWCGLSDAPVRGNEVLRYVLGRRAE